MKEIGDLLRCRCRRWRRADTDASAPLMPLLSDVAYRTHHLQTTKKRAARAWKSNSQLELRRGELLVFRINNPALFIYRRLFLASLLRQRSQAARLRPTRCSAEGRPRLQGNDTFMYSTSGDRKFRRSARVRVHAPPFIPVHERRKGSERATSEQTHFYLLKLKAFDMFYLAFFDRTMAEYQTLPSVPSSFGARIALSKNGTSNMNKIQRWRR